MAEKTIRHEIVEGTSKNTLAHTFFFREEGSGRRLPLTLTVKGPYVLDGEAVFKVFILELGWHDTSGNNWRFSGMISSSSKLLPEFHQAKLYDVVGLFNTKTRGGWIEFCKHE